MAEIIHLSSLTFAVELNATNVAQPPFKCHTAKVSCYLGEKNIDSIAIDTFSNHTNLKELKLHKNQISDLSFLSGLTNLQKLRLHKNQISDLSPLSGLTNLVELRLYDNKISNLSPLSGLTNLQILRLSHNQISNLSPLSGLTNLITLHLHRNPQLSDLSPLSGLTNLTELRLYDSKVSDLSPLSGLTNLRKLNIHNNQISNLSPLSNMTYLEYLHSSENQISDLSPLSGLTNLTELYLSHNKISYLSSLSGLSNIKKINFSHNQVFDFSPLSGLTNISTLSASLNCLNVSDTSVHSYLNGFGASNLSQDSCSAPYGVIHYKEQANGLYSSGIEQSLVGTMRESTSALYQNHPGYLSVLDHPQTVLSGIVSPEKGLTLKLYYGLNRYTLDFEENGGTDVVTQTGIAHNTIGSTPADPIKAGYTFDGWYTDAGYGTLYDFSVPLTDNVTVYAQYKKAMPIDSLPATGGSSVY